jgi:hypothetical protein
MSRGRIGLLAMGLVMVIMLVSVPVLMLLLLAAAGGNGTGNWRELVGAAGERTKRDQGRGHTRVRRAQILAG